MDQSKVKMSKQRVWPLTRAFFLLFICILSFGFHSPNKMLQMSGESQASFGAKQVTEQDAQAKKSKFHSAHIQVVQILKIKSGVTLEIHRGKITKVNLGVSIPQAKEWEALIGSKYVLGDIHATDVRPLLWRKLKVRLRKTDGSIAEITMLRPLWWLKATSAKEGSYLDLTVREAGLRGRAKVLSITSCESDSRTLEFGNNLVIGKIKHQNAKVLRLFLNQDKKSIGITPNHPIFSLDQNGWVPAGKLKIGENLKTAGGKPAFVRNIERGRKQTVFNLEVHQAKSYTVGILRILVHNTGIACPDEIISRLPDNIFKNRSCQDCAEGVVKALDESGHTGQVIHVQSKSNFLMNDLISTTDSITDNGYHVFVKVDDRIYDNFLKRGVPADDYIKNIFTPFGYKIKNESFSDFLGAIGRGKNTNFFQR